MTARFDDVGCTVCGCVCDDLSMQVRDGQLVGMERACSLAEPWFAGPFDSAQPCLVRGQPASLSDAIDAAAQILRGSRAPLIYGLSRSSTAGQRAAVALADRIGAVIDTTASTCHAPSILALQAAGESTSSLGEIRNRSNLIIYWGSNPVESHPRHLERFVDAPGLFIPRGRADRHLVVVDIKRTATAELADTFLQVEPGSDFDVLWALRTLVLGVDMPRQACGGVPFAYLEQLAHRMMSCRYGAVFFGLGLTRHSTPHVHIEALLRLVTDLHRHTRFVARRMRIPGDVAGADSVLCWQTGFPFSVSLSRGYPRYNPGEFSAGDLLEQGEVDAAVMVGAEGVDKLSSTAQRHLASIPTIVLDYPGRKDGFDPDVKITTAVYGVHRAGTAYRMDETPIPLRPFLQSPLPSDDEVLRAMLLALQGDA